MLVRERAQGRFEVDVEEVGDYEDDVAFLRDVGEQVGDARDLSPRASRLGEQELTNKVQQMVATPAGRKELADAIREQHEADAVVVVKRRYREQRGHVSRQLALGDGRRPEPRARADVDREEDVELALLAEFLDVGNVHPGGDVPVDRADIVSRLVLADLLEIESGAPEDAAIRANERLVREDARLDLDLFHDAKDLGRHRLHVWFGNARDPRGHLRGRRRCRERGR